uniref:Fibrinogen C-terminal domain-containing protein n=1 Tax=Amphimedon queenslandica TaxID=400682 RepID=A0A1X7TL22_AMPQE
SMDRFINDVYYRSPPDQPRGPHQDANGYELVDLSIKTNVQSIKTKPKDKRAKRDARASKKPAWSKPVIVLTILLSLMLALLVIMLCMIIAVIAVIPAKDDLSAPDLSCNCTELIDDLIYQESFPNFTQWADDVVHSVRESFPNFTLWSDHVVYNVKDSLMQQTNDVVHRVNTNVTLSIPKFTEIDSQILQTARTSAQDLASITSTLVTVTSTLTTVTDTLASLQDTSTSTAGVVDDILARTRETLTVLANLFPVSCKQILTQFPSSPSDYYTLASNNGSTYSAYCNMEELCGSGEGWTRLAYLDMSDSTVNCPSGFRLYYSGGVRACGRPTTNGGSCASVQFSSNGIRYSQICGRVTGYKYNSPDAVIYGYSNINSTYVDGVSITRGSLRNHVWTLIASWQENYCPCSTSSSYSVPSFVGSHYFCEFASSSGYSNQIDISYPLWDGQGCSYNDRACCSAPGIPWFHRDYGNTTSTDYIELRVCGDQGTSNEDVPVGYYEIYVK